MPARDQHQHLDPGIHGNIVVAVSFSSIIDANSNDLYESLLDQDLVVKKNALTVLTYSILNRMINVGGRVGFGKIVLYATANDRPCNLQ